MAKQPDWDVERYEGRHNFVWEMGADMLALLDPKAGETIVDLGCGPGQLTAKIAETGANVIGIDSAPSMIAQARINYPKLQFMLSDGATFQLGGPVDAVFSNAALHWMRPPEAVAHRIAKALKPGGRFVAEFGGAGNVRMILDALQAVTGGEENPWYFPSIGEYATLLERFGLEVRFAQLIDRPTPLAGEDGIQEWVKMFGAAFLALSPKTDEEDVLRRVEERVRPGLYRDGTWYADYRRLRVIASKKA